jgi:hypothetical protein
VGAIFPVRYVLRPKEALLTFLARRPRASRLSEPIAFSHRQSYPEDHDYPGQTAAFESYAKLGWLATFESLRASWTSAGDERGLVLAELLGDVPRMVMTFDRWWLLDRESAFTEGDFDLDERIDQLPLDALRTVEGPRERSAAAEAACQKLRDEAEEGLVVSYGEDWREQFGSSAEEMLARAKASADDLIRPVGAWWDELLVERANPNSRTR